MAYFTPAQLKTWLRYASEDDFDAAAAELAEQVVAGWLADATETVIDSMNPPPQMFAWALELGGIAYENPTSMSDDAAGETSTSWMDRRSQILAAARRWAAKQPSTAAGVLPRGCFPPAQPWPDAAAARRRPW